MVFGETTLRVLTGRAVLLGPLQPVAAGCILLQPVTAVTACYSLLQSEAAGGPESRPHTQADSLLTTTTDCYTSIPLSFAQTNILFLCTELRCYNRYKVIHPQYPLLQTACLLANLC